MIKEYVSNCQICQRNKVEHLWPVGLLQPIPIPYQVWSDISMDFIESLSILGRYICIMVIVDRFNKYTHYS